MLFKKKNPLPASQDFHNSQHSVTSSQRTVLQGCSSSADGARNHFNLFYHGRQRPQSVSDCAYWRPTRYKRENRGSGRRRKSIFPGRHNWEYVFGWTEKDMASSLYLLSRHSQNYFIFIGTQVNFHSLQSRLANFTKLGIICRGASWDGAQEMKPTYSTVKPGLLRSHRNTRAPRNQMTSSPGPWPECFTRGGGSR